MIKPGDYIVLKKEVIREDPGYEGRGMGLVVGIVPIDGRPVDLSILVRHLGTWNQGHDGLGLREQYNCKQRSRNYWFYPEIWLKKISKKEAFLWIAKHGI